MGTDASVLAAEPTASVTEESPATDAMDSPLAAEASAPAESNHRSGASAPAPSGKLGQILTAIGASQGATLGELVAQTGWLPHTTRAALTRLRQRGHPIRLVSTEGRKAYRLASDADATTDVGGPL